MHTASGPKGWQRSHPKQHGKRGEPSTYAVRPPCHDCGEGAHPNTRKEGMMKPVEATCMPPPTFDAYPKGECGAVGDDCC